MRFRGRLVLLDIEGTCSTLAFVHEVMFPYAAQHLAAFLAAHAREPAVAAALERVAQDGGHASVAALAAATGQSPEAAVRGEIARQMAADLKVKGLKDVQGMIWRDGFLSGEMRAVVFPDVPEAIARWRQAGLDVAIYSSGSVAAQKLFFAHTTAGDLTPQLGGYYDAEVGGKKEAASYRAIAAARDTPPAQILFVSDVALELDAARAAGCATALAMRPGNAPVAAGHGHPEATSFAQLDVERA